MAPNLVLVGFMGCGKSSVGRRLASLTGLQYIDSDDLIAQAEGCTIAEIFARAGEESFRETEHRTLAALCGTQKIILATGGGAILRADNRDILRQIGVVGWLDAEPDHLFERASRSGRRPLLQVENPRAAFDHLLANRRHLYEQVADFRLDTTSLDHDAAAQAFLDEALRHAERFEC